MQPFIKDNSRTVGDVIKDAIATIGENIQVKACDLAVKISIFTNVHSCCQGRHRKH